MQQDRADGNEDVLADEHADIVHRGRVGTDQPACRFRRRAVAGFGGFRHRRDQRPDHLGVPAQGRQAKCGGDLADEHIEQQHAAGGGGPHAPDQRLGPFLQAASFQQADDRHHQPDDRDIAVLDEGVAERGHDRDGMKPSRQAGNEAGHCDDQQRVESNDEPNDDNKDA
jgi:hypothetical protein